MVRSLRPLLWPLMLVLLVLLPPYAFERLTEFYYLAHETVQFFALSGTRLYLDVAWVAISSALVGAKSRSVLQAWLVVAGAVGAFTALTFGVCEPRLCYSGGVDGLEPVRLGSLLWSVGTTLSFLAAAGRAKEVAPWQRGVASFAAFYTLAFYPVTFTFAGARILPPADPFVVLILVWGLGMVLTAKSSRGGLVPGVAGATLACVVLVALGLGMAAQYAWQEAPFAAEALGGTVLGVAVAGLGAGRGAVTWVAESRVPALALLLLALLSTLVVFPDAAIGQVAAASNQGTPGSYSADTSQYVGGFMSSPMVRAHAVAVNVSLAPGHVRGAVYSGLLAAGLGVHAADCCTDGIDYGYRMDAVQWGNGTTGFVASSWEVCDANAACGGHSWKILTYYRATKFDWIGGDEIRLQVGWENRTVVWRFEDGNAARVAGTFAPPPRVNPVFNAGALPAFLGGGAYFFQFGVSAVGHDPGGWAFTFSCPSVLLNGTWSCADHAQTLQGDQSYWKALWRWGEPMAGVEAVPVPSQRQVTFEASNETVGSFVQLW